jgi:hypothetical protein
MKDKKYWIFQKFSLIIITIYIIVSILLIFFNIIDNNLRFIEIQNFTSYEVVYSENILSILSLNITIVTTLAGLAVAVVTFLLGRTNIKLSDYLYLVANKDKCLVIIFITLINTFLSLFVIYQPYTIVLDIWLKIGIIPSIVLFIVLIKNFEIVDKEEEMKHYLLFLLNRKDRKFIDFMLKITNNNFVNEFYDILFHVMENTIITDKKYLFSVNQEIIHQKKEKNIDYILKMQLFVLPRPDEELFDEFQNKYLDMAFKQYKKLIFEDYVGYNNFILRIKSNLYSHILYNEKLTSDQEENLINKYLNLMFRSYELVVIILNQGNIKDTREAINDFLGLVQFFSVNKMINRNDAGINKIYDNYLVGIICWIFDFIIIRDLSVNFIDIARMLLKRINEIDLSGIETDMFEEVIADINFHQVRYTRTFFIALSFLFLDDPEIHETLEKIKNDKDHYINQYKYQAISDVYNNITVQERRSLNIPNEIFEDRVAHIIEIINTKIKNITNKQIEDITNSKIKAEILENQRNKIENELDIFFNNDEKDMQNSIEEFIQFISLIPKRYLIGDSSMMMIGLDMYKTNVLLYFYNNYIKDCEKLGISKISDVFEENTNLIMPSYLNDYVFRHGEYNYKDDGIEIDNKYYPVMWIQTRGPIITLNDLKKFVYLPKNAVKIIPGGDTNKNGEIYTECDIKIKYLKNKSIKRIGYSIL